MDIEFVSGRGARPPSGTAAGPTTVTAEVYRNPARYGDEVHHVLLASWLVAGHSSAVAGCGDYLVWDGIDQSVVVTRDSGGQLHAFHNVCQHRGVRLVDGPGGGPVDELVCPWHGFAYNLAGHVSAVPRRASFAPELLAGLCAPPVSVVECAGLVWINLATGPVDELQTWLGELDEELGAYGMDEWYLVGQRQWTIDANWKAAVEGFSEDYHARIVHDSTIPSGLDYSGTQISLFERHSMMVTPLAGVDYGSLVPPVDHRTHAYSHYSVFPTTIFSCFPTHAQVMSFVPLGVDRTELRVWVVANRVAPAGVTQEKYERRMATGVDHFAAIAEEDVGVINRLASTRSSIGYRQNIYGSLESRISLFHRVLGELVDAHSSRGPSGPKE
jgi:choline monooxygenase